jgi:hypothetical protein
MSENEMPEQIDIARAALGGALLSKWFPPGPVRKVLMALCVVVGFQGFLTGSYLYFLSFLVAGIFSPRIVGELAFAVGRIAGRFSSNK